MPESRAKIEQALTTLLRRPISLRFEKATGEEPGQEAVAVEDAASSRRRDEAVVDDDPMVRKLVELFEARRLHLDYDDEANRPSSD